MSFNPYPAKGLTEEQRAILAQIMNKRSEYELFREKHGPLVASITRCKDSPHPAMSACVGGIRYEAHMPIVSSLVHSKDASTASFLTRCIQELDIFLHMCTVPQTKEAQDALRRVYAAAFDPSIPRSPKETSMKPEIYTTISAKGVATLRRKAKAQRRLKNGRFAKGKARK